MIEIASQYLGNIDRDERLLARSQRETCLKVHLHQSDCGKGRIHAHTDCGVAVGIIKSRDRSLQSGDVFQTKSEKLLLIHLQSQKLMVLSFSDSTAEPAKLIHLGHVLGNHHWPMIVKDNVIYLQPVADTSTMEATINNFQIPGLKIAYQMRSEAMSLGLSPAEYLDFSHHNHSHS